MRSRLPDMANRKEVVSKADPWSLLQERIEQSEKMPITVVLGAGIHALHQPMTGYCQDACNRLKCWNNLIADDNTPVDDAVGLAPTLRWEQKIISDAAGIAAFRNEKIHLKSLVKSVERSEKILQKQLSTERFAKLKSILKSPCVSDIVSLNVDLIIERLLLCHRPIPRVQGRGALARHRLITIGKTKKRIWHPHGDRVSYDSMQFGMRRYGLIISALELARKKFKSKERKTKKNDNEPETWIDLFMSRPLLFLGTSIDQAEWDIWFGLLTRFRNFANTKTRAASLGCFVLTTQDEHVHLPRCWFTRLDAGSYPQGWDLLGNAFTPDRRNQSEASV